MRPGAEKGQETHRYERVWSGDNSLSSIPSTHCICVATAHTKKSPSHPPSVASSHPSATDTLVTLSSFSRFYISDR